MVDLGADFTFAVIFVCLAFFYPLGMPLPLDEICERPHASHRYCRSQEALCSLLITDSAQGLKCPVLRDVQDGKPHCEWKPPSPVAHVHPRWESALEVEVVASLLPWPPP